MVARIMYETVEVSNGSITSERVDGIKMGDFMYERMEGIKW